MPDAYTEHGAPPLAIGVDDQLVPVFLATTAGVPQTGSTSPTLSISLNGVSFASLSDGTWAEIGNGW